jgi:hypothetical protein
MQAESDSSVAPMDEDAATQADTVVLDAVARLRDAANQPEPISGWRKVSVYDLRVLLTYFDAAQVPTP